jgi:hypothetical protein
MDLRSSLCLFSLAMAACTGGQTGVPASGWMDAGTVDCAEAADAATALGVRGVDLWDAFEGEYVVNASGSIVRERQLVPLPARTYTFTIARTDERIPGAAPCDIVEVAVRVRWRSSDGASSGDVVGRMQGTSAQGFVDLLTPDAYDPRNEAFGGLSIVDGEVTFMRLQLDDGSSWFLPPPRKEDP